MERTKLGYLLIVIGLVLMFSKFIPMTFLSAAGVSFQSSDINVSAGAEGPAVDIISIGFVFGFVLVIIGIYILPQVQSLWMEMFVKTPVAESSIKVIGKKNENIDSKK